MSQKLKPKPVPAAGLEGSRNKKKFFFEEGKDAEKVFWYTQAGHSYYEGQDITEGMSRKRSEQAATPPSDHHDRFSIYVEPTRNQKGP